MLLEVELLDEVLLEVELLVLLDEVLLEVELLVLLVLLD